MFGSQMNVDKVGEALRGSGSWVGSGNATTSNGPGLHSYAASPFAAPKGITMWCQGSEERGLPMRATSTPICSSAA